MTDCFGLTTFPFSQSDMIQIVIRLAAAFLVGAIIGLNREMKRRGAGIKTHSLVCTSAALIMMTGEFLHHCYGTGDVARLGAQVISGVGFLGVGTIMVTGRSKVKGLTTAATLWTSACLGLAIGSGFLLGAVVVGVLVMLDLVIMGRIDDYIETHSKIVEMYIEFKDTHALTFFVSVMRKMKFNFSFTEMNKVKLHSDSLATLVTVKLQHRSQYQDFMELVKELEGINFYDEL